MGLTTITALNLKSTAELFQHVLRNFTPFLNSSSLSNPLRECLFSRITNSTCRNMHCSATFLTGVDPHIKTVKKDQQKHIQSIANVMECSVDDVNSMIKKYPFILHMSTHLIELKVKLLLSYNFPMSLIKKNPKPIYYTSNEELKRRLQLLKEKSFLTENPILHQEGIVYYLVCHDANFDLYFGNLCSELDALEGCASQCEYLQHRLKCTKETADSMLSSYPLSKHISNCKIKSVLDFFLNEVKVGPEYVIKNKRFFSFSLTRLRQRWTIMQSAGVALEEYADFWNLTEKQFQKKFQKYFSR